MTAALATVHPLSQRGAHDTPAALLRLVPSDGLQPVPMARVQDALTLDLHGAAGMPVVTEYDAATRSRLSGVHEAEVKAWAARFAQAVVEALGGDRPVSQLVRWTSRDVYADLERRVQLLGLARAGRPTRVVRPQVRSVHVFRPAVSSAEVTVHVRHGQRSRALAARLDRRGERWLCTAMELG